MCTQGRDQVANFCPYSGKCWRHAYSRYLLDVGYTEPPDRMTMCLAGYASVEIAQPKCGLYAETMPQRLAGVLVGLCPLLTQPQGNVAQCGEYVKEQRRVAASERSRQRMEAYRNRTGRTWIAKDVKRRVAERDRYCCVYCGVNAAHAKCVIDHLVPLALGGTSDETNLVFCCRKCNSDKGAQVWQRGCRL